MLLVVVAMPACALKPTAEPPKDDPNRAENVRKAHLTISVNGPIGPTALFDGTAEIWFDRDQGLYRLHVTLKIAEGAADGKPQDGEVHVIVSPERVVLWERQGREQRKPKQHALKTEAGAEPLLEEIQLGDLGSFIVPYVDAVFGFKRLKTEAKMEASESPLAGKDELRWYEVKPRDDAQDGLARTIGKFGGRTRVWLGVSPATGWPMSYVARGVNGDEAKSTLTKVDTNPDLKGVFDLPAEVKAKLEEK